MRAALITALLTPLICGVAFAQDPPNDPPALARSTGMATISQPANSMTIAVEQIFEAATFNEAWPAAAGFRTSLEDAIKQIGDQVSLRMALNVEQTNPPQVAARGAVAINLGPLLGQQDGETALVVTLDQVAALCKNLGAATGAIAYELSDEAPLRREAVRRATENAYHPADAIAEALRADLYNVDEVKVTSVEIVSGPPPLSAQNPSTTGREVSCTATVEVSYLLEDR